MRRTTGRAAVEGRVVRWRLQLLVCYGWVMNRVWARGLRVYDEALRVLSRHEVSTFSPLAENDTRVGVGVRYIVVVDEAEYTENA